MPTNLRARITLTASIFSALALGVAAVLMIGLFRRQLLDNLDEGLRNRAETIAAVIGRIMPADLSVEDDLLVQVVAVDGSVLVASDNLRGAGPIAPNDPGTRTIRTIPDRPDAYRVLTSRISTSSGDAFLSVGTNFDDVTDPSNALKLVLATTVPAMIAALGLLTWWVTGRTLRPVEEMRTELARISATNPGRRIREPGNGDEIDRLAHTMNATLDRLEDAIRSQQRFVADASHELRGPLTRIRAQLEVDLVHPSLAQPFDTERSVLNDTIALQHLVDDLLHLARSDADVTDAKNTLVDLDDVVLREARRVVDRGRVTVDTRKVSAAVVHGDPRHLSRAIGNLLENAERHAITTITVSVSVEESDRIARLVVSDDGPGIAPEQHERVFERFTRLDDARTRDTGGTGLGLAITREILERHGGSIRIAPTPTTQFVIELPAHR